jgi:hypothetical protein
MAKTPTRLFTGSYDDVITKAQSMQPQFEADLPEFTAFNPWFTGEVNARLIEETAIGLADYSESSHTAEIVTQTEKIAGLLTQSGKSYQKLMYYVENGLGDTKAVMDTFGRSRYEKARRSEKEMVSLLKQAVTAASQEEFAIGLAAAGMPASLTTDLEELADILATADGKQEMLKKQQLLITSERIALFNSIWDILSRISSASKIIYAEDPARLAIYQLYDSSSSDNEQPETPA